MLVPQAQSMDASRAMAQPIFALIEQRFREPIVQIQQDIGSITLNDEQAAFLEVPRQSSGLEITRRHIDKGRRTMEVARSVHPSGSFKYCMNVQLELGACAAKLSRRHHPETA